MGVGAQLCDCGVTEEIQITLNLVNPNLTVTVTKNTKAAAALNLIAKKM